MNEVKVDEILQQIRALSKEAGFDKAGVNKVEENGVDFSTALNNSIDSVNQQQQTAGSMAKEFELGSENVDLSEVMIQMQKARVSFEALSQVRNKLINAYQEIMNMQI